MEAIKEFINVVNPRKISKLTPGISKNSKLGKLYEEIWTKKVTNNSDLVEFAERHDWKNHRQLKSNLENRLIDLLFLIEPDFVNTEVRKAYFECYKRLSAAKLLMSMGAKRIGFRIAENTLRKAMRYDFTEVVLLLATELQHYYGVILGNRKKLVKYSEVVETYNERYHAENKVRAVYTELTFFFTNSSTTTPELGDMADRHIKKLKPLIKKDFDSYRFRMFLYNIYLIKHQALNDYSKIITTCGDALDFFRTSGKNLPYTVQFTFTYKCIPAHIQLLQIKDAKEKIATCLNLAPYASYNWHVTLIYQVILAFYSGQYQLAHEAILLSRGNMASIGENIQEIWRIIEAYVMFFISTEKIKVASTDRKFRLGKFLNEVPIFTKDKRGSNINILIIQILFLLHRKKRGALIDRTESLKMYVHRHLRNDETFRSNCFIRMLLQLPAANFNKIALERKARPYYEKLIGHPTNIARQGSEIEIVPYETLWECVLEML